MQDQQRDVRTQYATDRNLSTRISIHDRYSVNKQGFLPWNLAQYAWKPGDRVLELGCGNGEIWARGVWPEGCEIFLTDFSTGMVEAARQRIGDRSGASFMRMDAMDIAFGNRSFDMVIANMMLYHVPDIDRALSEIRRVLRPGGVFCCATYGEDGIAAYLQRMFDDLGVTVRMNTRFTLQSGEALLRKHFDSVERRDYHDALEVTDVEDLIDYMLSLTSIAGFDRIPREELRRRLLAQQRDGLIRVPKEYGMFMCR